VTGFTHESGSRDEAGIATLPTIKFLKRTVPDILDGSKTLEARPRSEPWIRRIRDAPRARLTYGPMRGAPTVFAVARIRSVEVRGFETATQEDLGRIGPDWAGRGTADFSAAYADWYAKELGRGYAVAWISFEVDRGWSP
jgi:hypothetical protein